MTLHEVFTLVSLSMTIPVLLSSLLVLALWFKPALSGLRSLDRTDTQWFVIGVALSFFGSTIDNLYWGIAWTAEYLHHPAKEELFRAGVYSNVPFRQTCTLLAAICHIRAAVSSDSLLFRNLITTSWFMGLMAATVLLWVR